MRQTITAALIAAAIAAGCGGSDSGSSSPAPADDGIETPNEQAQREYEVCQQQGDQIANTQGADAGTAHLRECTDQYARDLQVEP